MRRIIVWLIAAVIVGGIISVLWTPDRAYRNRDRAQCLSNLDQIQLARAQYVQDYDEVLPLASVGKQGWVELLRPYLKSEATFQCPSAEKTTKELSSDYFLNACVAGQKRSRISFGAQTILFGDGLDNGATNSRFSELPLNWKIYNHSPAKRHLDGANYAFVHGHVKWLKPEKISSDAPKNGNATFAVR